MRKLRVPWIIAAVFAVLAVVTMFAGAPAVQAGSADQATAVATFTPIDAMVAGDVGQTAYMTSAAQVDAGYEAIAAAQQSARTAEEGLQRLGADGVQNVGVANAAP